MAKLWRQSENDPTFFNHRPYATAGIPAELMREAFGEFVEDCRSIQFRQEDINLTHALAERMAGYFTSEAERLDASPQVLQKHYPQLAECQCIFSVSKVRLSPPAGLLMNPPPRLGDIFASLKTKTTYHYGQSDTSAGRPQLRVPLIPSIPTSRPDPSHTFGLCFRKRTSPLRRTNRRNNTTRQVLPPVQKGRTPYVRRHGHRAEDGGCGGLPGG